MFVIDVSLFFDSLLIFCLAFVFDLVFGELPDSIHPTWWMGKVIAYLKPKIASENSRVEKMSGVLLGIFVIMLFAVPVYFMIFLVREFLGWIPYIVVSAFMLYTAIAIKCMRQYTLPIAESVENQDYEKVKKLLPFIVRRDPNGLNKRHIISAAVETIAEGTTDGITSPFFYFALFGVPGAIAFRVINTLDSMVGYKDQEHVNIGWFSAKMDTIANYIPARLTAILMVLAALLLKENWRKSWRILQRDKKNTESLNAGWTLSAMAGTLSIQLEKPGFYRIGDNADVSSTHIIRALRVMLLTAILFSIFIILPILVMKTLIIIFLR
ncbi:MAG: cobalamin biosynthesis protein [Candidatus Bathyarchaeum sp.]|nr:MAG: cobalamin biosynthesis protein [Candidatus Bathyarchaeum sp.]